MRGLCREPIGTIPFVSYLQTYISIITGLYYILAIIMSILYYVIIDPPIRYVEGEAGDVVGRLYSSTGSQAN